ncbi:MAG: response regulator transcription factor [Chloroflexota bacterium]
MSVITKVPIRILLVDRHALVRAGLRVLLESRPGLIVVGEASGSAEALTLAAKEDPDIILYEPEEEQEEGIERIAEWLAGARKARLLLVTDGRDTEVHHRAVRLGAIGVVFKDQSAEVLFKAIEKIHAGEAWFDRTMVANVLTQFSRARAPATNPEAEKIAALSEREREIITLIGMGLKNKEIGDRLCISEITVRHHLTSVFAKLGTSDRLELVIYAYQNGLAQLPR